ncbi:unnamed protein product [Brassica rapa]|uniref:Uncharacterized protein n=1 Tax=Brassica campestris TaxID=3711 RepID=A0A3P6BR48_BRACM|nr:unnamed protein product [Brassica rapa]VDD03524.1 unnamed protein product [Brassica rapa]
MVAFKILDVLSYWIENVNRFKELSYTTYDVLMCLYHYGDQVELKFMDEVLEEHMKRV